MLLRGGNVAFHLEAHFDGTAENGIRVGLAVVVMLITLIGGRIVPSFTRNWLARENPGRLPVPFGRFDMLTVAASAIALVFWIVLPRWHRGPAWRSPLPVPCKPCGWRAGPATARRASAWC